ncbi:hypothetical protein GCM10025767_04310 [Thalassotalea piscium]
MQIMLNKKFRCGLTDAYVMKINGLYLIVITVYEIDHLINEIAMMMYHLH